MPAAVHEFLSEADLIFGIGCSFTITPFGIFMPRYKQARIIHATNDAVAMGVALVVFWPAAFFVKGDGPEAEEYAKLLGERRAIEAASKRQGCNIKFVALQGSDKKEKKPEGNPGHVIQ